MTLDELALKYGTDKSSTAHNYCQFYERTLPKKPKKLLEIGVFKGASLAMWSEYFPDTEIWGVDLFADHSEADVRSYLLDECGCKNIVLRQGNQCDYVLLDALRNEDFDIVIDDGSHNSRDQMMTFYGLYNGRHYYIEDLHTCDQEFYRAGLPVNVSAKRLGWPFTNVFYDCQSPIVLIQSER